MKTNDKLTLADLVSAMKRLKARTGDSSLGHNVAHGKFTLVRVTYDSKGNSTVQKLSKPQCASDHLHTLNTFGMEGGAQ
jgi:hypothetical protein